jgi:hypothetical protein
LSEEPVKARGTGAIAAFPPSGLSVNESAHRAMLKLDVLKRYLLPGLVIQSLVIAGGYGTGRELVEFFLSYGPLGGLLAMVAVNTVI